MHFESEKGLGARRGRKEQKVGANMSNQVSSKSSGKRVNERKTVNHVQRMQQNGVQMEGLQKLWCWMVCVGAAYGI